MQKEFKNLFCDFTDSELEKCYRSRIRILNKTNEDYEPYKDMVKKYNVRAVCAVGMSRTGTQTEEVRAKNFIPKSIPLFTLQGNFDLEKLHGVYKMTMNMMVKTAGKSLAEKTDRTPEEDDLLEMMTNGKGRVCLENLNAVIEWYHNKR